jgi:hypothetical protein
MCVYARSKANLIPVLDRFRVELGFASNFLFLIYCIQSIDSFGQ